VKRGTYENKSVSQYYGSIYCELFCGDFGSGRESDIIIASANPMTGNSAQFGQYKVKGIQLVSYLKCKFT
jgi:hypothetical protein